ncbi:MAG TPA: phage terminase large subunit [Burkholderiaceae bacterium]|nr:phage terminase large subunit [Burkholderiaceae bacterium]
MSELSKQAYLAAVKADALVFLQQAFTTIYPGKEFMPNWHLDALLHGLEEGLRGKMPRLIINLPPRHLKSFIVSVVWPAFILGQDPSAKIICISYSDDLAKALSRDFKRIVESDWYRAIFPNVRLTKVTEGEVITDAGGGRYATSVGGTLTGRGADFILIDDPIKPEEATSDKARQAVNEWYRSTLLSRLDDKQRSVLILVMQRLHVNDLTGYVEAGGGFQKLSFPAIATRDDTVELRNGGRYFRREGEPLHGDREGIEVLKRIRDEVGNFNFSSQYQQSPATPDGSMFKRKWFKLTDQAPEINSTGTLYVSIDSAISTSDTADYSAFSVIYAHATKYFVVQAERGRWDYESLKAKALGYVKQFSRSGFPVHFVIERAGSGISLLKYLEDLRHERIRCFNYSPKSDKVIRAAYAIPIVESGRVYIVNVPGQNAWVEPYINEFVSFPHGRFDDQVDSLTQFLPWADKRHNPRGGFYVIN